MLIISSHSCKFQPQGLKSNHRITCFSLPCPQSEKHYTHFVLCNSDRSPFSTRASAPPTTCSLIVSLSSWTLNYRAPGKSMYFLLSRTQAGPGRTVEQEQDEISRNHVQTFSGCSVQCRPLVGSLDNGSTRIAVQVLANPIFLLLN